MKTPNTPLVVEFRINEIPTTDHPKRDFTNTSGKFTLEDIPDATGIWIPSFSQDKKLIYDFYPFNAFNEAVSNQAVQKLTVNISETNSADEVIIADIIHSTIKEKIISVTLINKDVKTSTLTVMELYSRLLLLSNVFYMLHRSYIVHKPFIKEIKTKGRKLELIMIDGKKIIVPKDGKTAFWKWYNS